MNSFFLGHYCRCMKEKLNKQPFGIIIGLILPVITTFIISNMSNLGDSGYWEFMKTMFTIQSLGKLVSLCVLPNLLVFLLALKIDYLWIVRGLIIATAVYTGVVLILVLTM